MTLFGATVNTAARYEQAKSPDLGQIRVRRFFGNLPSKPASPLKRSGDL